MTGTETGAGRPLERGLLMNALGIIVKASRTVYLILFGRILGAEGFGIYLLAFAVQEFISKFAILGLNWGGKQIVGALKAQGKNHSIRPTVIRILWITLSFSSLVAVAMAQGAALLAAMLNQDSLAGPLRIFAIGFPFLCGMYVLVYSFRPNLNMKYEMVVTSIVEPMSVLLLGIAFLSGFRNVEVLAWAHVGASIVAFFTALYFFNRIYPSIESRGGASIDWSMLLHGSATMGGMELVGNLQSKIDLFIMALFFPPHIIGIYGAATQIASLLRKSRAAFDPILMPIAQLLHLRSDHQQLQAEVSRAVGWAVCIGLGLLGLMVLIPQQLLGLFGSEFSGGIFGTVLIILAIGQFFHMSGGLSEGILAITGHGYVSLVSGVILVLSECALLFALIPLWGLTGAAIAASVPFIGVTLWRVAQTRRLLGIGMFTMDQTRIVLAWAACLAAALVVSRFTPDDFKLNVAAAAIVYLAAYAVVSWRWWPAGGRRTSD
jgi:O-antigen/teichoic acid export membrane protein